MSEPVQRLWHKAVREPLVHFLAAALVLCIAGEFHRRQADTYRIVVTPQREALLASRYALQFGQRPNSVMLARLVERDLDDEILYRQGLALGLDKDDEIVRRRIIQKMRFLLQDLSAPAEPSDAELQAYYQAHADRYSKPARVTFSHLYFSPDRGDKQAQARAQQALDDLSKEPTSKTDPGDPFPDLSHFSAYEPEQVQRLFGQTEFSDAVFSAPANRWSGPYRSGYGWHLIRVDARQETVRQALSTVQDQVRTDYLLDAQTRANIAAFNHLAREFSVVHRKS
jgi:parvulin-like peptidyl-prolyl isomerase